MSRTVVTLVIDLIGSTNAGLEMHAGRFRKFNAAIYEQITPYIQDFDLDDWEPKFTGDGWLLTVPDLERTAAVVCLAKTMAHHFQTDIAEKLNCEPNEVPALRLAICSGDDEPIQHSNGREEWVGDSGRRATRAAECCGPNQLVVNGTIREKIFRVFDIVSINIKNLPVDRRPKRWEEQDLQIFSINDMRPDFIDDLSDSDQAIVAPYITYCEYIGQHDVGARVLSLAQQHIEDRIPEAASNIDQIDMNNPAVLANMVEVRAQMTKLLRAAPSISMQEQIVHRMVGLGIPPLTPTYNRLINLSPDYGTAKAWFEKMREAGVAPNEITATSLAKYVTSVAEADALTQLMLTSECFVGEGYFSRIYAVIARELQATELLEWHFKQKYKWSNALGAAISRYSKDGKLEDACRMALAFPYLPSSRKLFRERNEEATGYYSELLAGDFEPHNTIYALAYCSLEARDYDNAASLFEAALELASADRRRSDIETRLDEVRKRLRAA